LKFRIKETSSSSKITIETLILDKRLISFNLMELMSKS
jgi:hypothetical protein